jgi:hypothetical protein
MINSNKNYLFESQFEEVVQNAPSDLRETIKSYFKSMTDMQKKSFLIAKNHLGTSFGYIDDTNQGTIPFLTLPYVENSGYLFKNTNIIRHGMTMSVPDGFDRVSLYFYIN